MSKVFFLRGDSYAGLEMHAANCGLHRYARHSHDEYSVILVTGGAKLLGVDRSRFAVAPGQIVIVPPGTSHECEPLEGRHWAHRCWYISPDLVAEITGQAEFRTAPPDVSPVLDDPGLARDLARAHRDAEHERKLTADAHLHGLLAHAILAASGRPRPQPPVGPNTLSRAQTYIRQLESGLEEGLDLEGLAARGGVSRFQVIRDFNSLFHMSPGRALSDLRLRKSKQLLRAGHAMSEISARLGFSDQSHFTRAFKRAYAITPGRYAKNAHRPDAD